jgi:lactoylglutathione lyase
MTNHKNYHLPVLRLFETHLTVSDLKRSINFYQNIIGLQLAFEAPTRNAAFLWIGNPHHSMLGLWDVGSMPLGLALHIAFEVTIDNLLDAPRILKDHGITPLSFYNLETTQPSVIGWIPAATIFFRDPDGHLIEYLAMLDNEPNLNVGIIPWSEWITHEKCIKPVEYNTSFKYRYGNLQTPTNIS